MLGGLKPKLALAYGVLTLAAAVGLGLTLRLGDILMMPIEATGGRIAYAVILFAMWWTMTPN